MRHSQAKTILRNVWSLLLRRGGGGEIWRNEVAITIIINTTKVQKPKTLLLSSFEGNRYKLKNMDWNEKWKEECVQNKAEFMECDEMEMIIF